MNKRYVLLSVVVLLGLLCSIGIGQAQASTPGTVVAWGYNYYGQATVPAGLTDVVAVAAGAGHSLALKSDGTVFVWGDNSSGQATVPAGLSDVTAIAAGWYHSLALKSDGTVVAWGDNWPFGQATVPPGLTGVVAIAGGTSHSLALKSDGTVVAWGDNLDGQTDVPADLTDVVAISAGAYHNLALKSDGTVVGWGYNDYGQATVPAGLSDVVAVAAGQYHSLALKDDGTVVGWGVDGNGQATAPSDLTGVIAIAGGAYYSLALKSDGTLVAWGSNDEGQKTVPAGLTGVVAISAGYGHNLVLKAVGPIAVAPAVTTHPQSQSVNVGDMVSFSAAASGEPAPTLQWQESYDGGATWANVVDATSSPLIFTAVLYNDGGQYRAVFTNSAGSATSEAAILTLSKRPATITLSNLTQTYDGEPKQVTVTTDPPWLCVAVTYNGEGIAPYFAATYAVVATICDEFYEGSAYDTLIVQPKAASVTPTAAGKVYGEADPLLTGTLEGFVAADGVSAAYRRAAGEAVGDYILSAGLSPEGALANYAITYNTAPFSITLRPVTVSADAKTKVAGEPDPPLTYQITNGSLAFSDAFSGALTRDPGEDPGIYAIRQGTLALDGNYALAYIGADLTIVSVPVPILTGISPMAAEAGSADVSLTVAGSNFVAGSRVQRNGADLATTFVSATQLTAIIPAGNLASPQTAQITVFNPDTGSSPVLAFFVTEAPAIATGQDVASGPDPSAASGPATATATGDGLLVVAQYDANPGGTPSFSASGVYFDVYAAPDNSFSQVVISACNLSASDKLYWWDAAADTWIMASPQSYDSDTGCVTLTVDAASSPTLSQLAGTAFAAGTDSGPNTAPVAAPGGPYLGAINSGIAFDGSASSDAESDPLTYAWSFGDGATGTGATPTHVYSATGIYDVCLTVNDGALDSAPVCTLAVVYDPSAGFVTGGGWILSPAGAYKLDPSLSGRAVFGFVSKYKKGASVPEGNTEFQFQAGGFAFHSSAYEWLVVNKSGLTAQFKGAGLVNGTLDANGHAYKFMLWAGDGTSANGLDTFRVRIWWEDADGVEQDVYDNSFDQEIGGSIVVHTAKVKGASLEDDVSQDSLLYLPLMNAD